jgi:hypothetical protein
VRYHFFRLSAALAAAFCLSSSALTAAEIPKVRAFDAATVEPAEVTRGIRASASGTLFRVKGLRGAEGEPLTLALEPAPLFADGFRLYIDGREDLGRGRDAVARFTLLRGTVEEWPGSSVALTINGATGSWSGYLSTGDRLYEVALPAGEVHGPAADAVTVRPAALESSGNNFLPDALEPPAALEKALGASKVIAAPGSEYQASLAIESDHELLNRLGSVEDATEYLIEMVGSISELYFRQIGVSLAISSLSLYPTADDPWNAPNPHSGDEADVLCEFSSFWQRERPVSAFPRHVAMFFTGKSSTDIGGQAWRSGLCNYKEKPSACPYGGYGIVVMTKRVARDTFVTAHELGHVFGSRHTHCYSPPVDECYGSERGCYSGPESEPADGGSVMSYCRNTSLSLGEPGAFGNDSQRVVQVMRTLVDQVGPGCLLRTSDPYQLFGIGGSGSATLTWVDPFGSESNWLVEQLLPNGKFKQVKSLPANSKNVTVTKLKPGFQVFRVRAKFKKDVSDYSNTVTVTVR